MQFRSSSYVVFDSGYKYSTTDINDVYRFVPLNGDMAGLSARTDTVADSWFSPAGFNRGIVRGAVKLSVSTQLKLKEMNFTQQVSTQLLRSQVKVLSYLAIKLV